MQLSVRTSPVLWITMARSIAHELVSLAALVLLVTVLPACSRSIHSARDASKSVDPVPASETARQNEIGTAKGCESLAADAPDSAFVMLDTAAGSWVGCDIERARQRFLAASTFKVPHALIALETGTVVDPYAPVAWDGRQRRVAVWNQDTSLASGMEHSTVWFYQRTARQIGHTRMAEWVRHLDYGNGEIGDARDIANFWLDGKLRISAMEQVIFLDRLRRQALPAAATSQAIVAQLMQDADAASRFPGVVTLFRKSGAVLPINPETGDIDTSEAVERRLDGSARVGWFVGWVAHPVADEGAYVFALNLDLNEAADLGKRETLTRMLLVANGAWPTD
jgi:beta-lactamase class D